MKEKIYLCAILFLAVIYGFCFSLFTLKPFDAEVKTEQYYNDPVSLVATRSCDIITDRDIRLFINLDDSVYYAEIKVFPMPSITNEFDQYNLSKGHECIFNDSVIILGVNNGISPYSSEITTINIWRCDSSLYVAFHYTFTE